ncbi:MAG: NAD(P)/FAD-dependent oxidoreductase [Deltaproteobacteria bacterium]|nr:NAD(P)/FAD-dependent oxidoreductase [Deltaproteobacteria bacterium]
MAGPTQKHVVIIGGGFGGLWAARALKRARCRITLIDRRNHHLFQPLLYQVATATLDPSDIAAPIRSITRRQHNLSVLLAEVTAVDVGAKRISLSDGGELAYDYLVVATGATHSYFGKDHWARHAPGLKSLEDALDMRRRVLLAYEAAEAEPDPERRRAWLTFAIIGAGPTGVELAGALAEISRYSLRHDFRRIDPGEARVILIEGQPRVLPVFPEAQSEKARRQLVKIGVEVRTKVMVTDIDADGVTLAEAGREERLAARTVLWAAGVAASPLGKTLGAPLDRAGRVKVDPGLNLPGRDDVFVIGDLVSLSIDGSPVPGVSPAAMQAGTHVALSIRRALDGRGDAVHKFRYWNKGTFATIGRGAAVGDLMGRMQLSGFPAWLAWLGIHLFFLVGFRARLFVLFSWAYSYLSHRRGVRLITGLPLLPERRPPAPQAATLEPAPSSAATPASPTATTADAGTAARQIQS